MRSEPLPILLILLAFAVSLVMYPLVLRFAKKHNIVDNPNARKLQRVPVPVMGGVAVYFGIIAAVVVGNIIYDYQPIWVGLITMTIMLVIGIWDDIRDVPAMLRFIFEIILVWLMMYISDSGIDGLHGIWGYGTISLYFSLPLSIIAGVGIINAINMIDGVDGFVSGYGMMSCIMFAIMFHSVGDDAMECFALISAAALLPFFLHNVFGSNSKMFIGDSGTLMLGTMMTFMVFAVLSKNTTCAPMEAKGLGLIPFTLAVLDIPVFDTLRVMGARIVRGQSPFNPDKTHLHHLFVEMGYSHVGTSLTIIALDMVIIAIWWLSWKLGASIDLQLYIVMGLGILVTFGFYKFMRIQQMKGPKDEEGFPEGSRIWKYFCRAGNHSHVERHSIWNSIQHLVDGKFLG